MSRGTAFFSTCCRQGKSCPRFFASVRLDSSKQIVLVLKVAAKTIYFKGGEQAAVWFDRKRGLKIDFVNGVIRYAHGMDVTTNQPVMSTPTLNIANREKP